MWDVEPGTLRGKIHQPHRHGCILALGPDGTTLATSDSQYVGDVGDLGEGSIRLYDIQTGEQIDSLEPGDTRASVIVFSPDGSQLFTGFGRGSGIVWDVRRTRELQRAKK